MYLLEIQWIFFLHQVLIHNLFFYEYLVAGRLFCTFKGTYYTYTYIFAIYSRFEHIRQKRYL